MPDGAREVRDGMTSGRIQAPEAWCPNPHCQALLTGYTPVDEKAQRPEPGDFSVCCYCGAICRYVNAQGELRQADEGELDELDELMRTRLLLARQWIRTQGRKPPQRREQ